MAQYGTYTKKSFRTRQEAEEWAKKQKSELKTAGQGSAKLNISYQEKSQQWIAEILLPLSDK